MKKRSLLIVIAVIAIVAAVWSFSIWHNPPRETLDQRVQDVASQLICPVCQGESVASSPATIAQQMRAVIRQQLQAGESEAQVIQYFKARYGPQIVWTPQWQGFDLVAWLVPIALLLLGVVILFYVLRSWRAAIPEHAPPAAREPAEDADSELDAYREQLERELAAEDPIFAPRRAPGMEAR
ncbi:MAG: cytochrome c-type biogenesis protein [Ktedonobacteraceae bacterium]